MLIYPQNSSSFRIGDVEVIRTPFTCTDALHRHRALVDHVKSKQVISTSKANILINVDEGTIFGGEFLGGAFQEHAQEAIRCYNAVCMSLRTYCI